MLLSQNGRGTFYTYVFNNYANLGISQLQKTTTNTAVSPNDQNLNQKTILPLK